MSGSELTDFSELSEAGLLALDSALEKGHCCTVVVRPKSSRWPENAMISI